MAKWVLYVPLSLCFTKYKMSQYPGTELGPFYHGRKVEGESPGKSPGLLKHS